MKETNILFIGDIFGKAGKNAIHGGLPFLRDKYKPDIVIANGENIAGGFGITENLVKKLFRYGIDIITLGNHTWNKRDDLGDSLDTYENLLRPANYPPGNSGHGSTVFTTDNGIKVGVLNLMGRVYMPTTDCPFRIGRDQIDRLREQTQIIIVDFHAEATSEKAAMGVFLDGLVSAVIGTHTHVQTSDNRILCDGTAFITDCGMTGPHDSIIGVKTHMALEHLLKSVQVRFEPATEGIRIQGVFITIDIANGKASHIERIDIPFDEISLDMSQGKISSEFNMQSPG